MTNLLAAPFSYFADENGAPLAGGKVYTYAAGTNLPKDSYTDASGNFPNDNPVILDSAGRAEIWLSGSYRIKVTDANDFQVWETDQVASQVSLGAYLTTDLSGNLTISTGAGLGNDGSGNLALTAPSFRNALINGDMQIAQRNTSFTGINGFATPVQVLDGWFGWTDSTANMTISQQSGTGSFNKLMRLQRPNGNSNTATHRAGQIIKSADCKRFAGQSCILSFYARAGSNYSPTSSLMAVRVGQGSGTDEGSTGYTNVTWTGDTLPLNTTQAITTTLTRYSFAVTISSGTNEIGIDFGFTPTGTASTNDYLEITGVQFELAGDYGSKPSAYEFLPFHVQLQRCLPYYEKSFLYGTAPAQNAGTNTGEMVFIAGKAGAAAEYGFLNFKSKKFKVPTMTFYNPSAANAQVRDLTAAADCSSTSALRTSDENFNVTTTGNASTAVGNPLGIHWSAEAGI